MNETPVQQLVRLEAARMGMMLFRNNSGACRDDTGRLIRYGLGNDSEKVNKVFKSPDLVGFTPLQVTANMVGRKIAVFTGIDCKHSEWKQTKKFDDRETAQQAFFDVVLDGGGFAGFATGPGDLYRIIAR